MANTYYSVLRLTHVFGCHFGLEHCTNILSAPLSYDFKTRGTFKVLDLRPSTPIWGVGVKPPQLCQKLIYITLTTWLCQITIDNSEAFKIKSPLLIWICSRLLTDEILMDVWLPPLKLPLEWNRLTSNLYINCQDFVYPYT